MNRWANSALIRERIVFAEIFNRDSYHLTIWTVTNYTHHLYNSDRCSINDSWVRSVNDTMRWLFDLEIP